MSRKKPKFSGTRTATAVVAGGLALVLAACGGGSSGKSASAGGSGGSTSSTSWTPYTATAGDTVPTVKVKFGMRPYADNTFYEIAIKKGWFSDVGIDLDPAAGISTTEDQWTNLLLHGSTDINSDTCAILVTTYASSTDLKCIQHAVSFFGQVMFANPKLGLKSVEDYEAAGEDFKTALKDALTPLTKGDAVYVQPGTGEIAFTQEPFKYAGVKQPNFKPVSDSDMFTQAQAGKINFLHPGGAPIAVELLKLGWKPIYSTKTLVNGAPGSDSPFVGLVVNNGIAATAKYATSHEDTILRFTSVLYRIAAATKADPTLFDLQAPYLNSVAGTTLTGKDIADEFAEFHPLATFESAGKDYYDDPSSAQYYKTIGDAVIKDQVAAGTLKQGAVTADEFVWAPKVYADLAGYKKQYETIAAAGGGDTALMAKAKTYYDDYDYLDAARFALKAKPAS
jgi:hypothetical protein